MKEKKIKFNYWQVAVAAAAFVVFAGVGVVAASGLSYLINVQNATFNIDANGGEGQTFGGSTSDNWNVGGNLTVAGTSAFTGAVTATGGVTGPLTVTSLNNTSTSSPATTTLTNANSGTVYTIANASGTVIVLPATSTNSGVWYRFAIGGAIGTNVTIKTSDGGNDIEGAMIVAGAVVDCDAEDTITFVADGENIGDYIELYGNGTDWLIGSSGALTGSKMTCTAS